MTSSGRWLGEEHKCGASQKSPSDWFFLSSFTVPFLITLYGHSVTFLQHENTCGLTHSNKFSYHVEINMNQLLPLSSDHYIKNPSKAVCFFLPNTEIRVNLSNGQIYCSSLHLCNMIWFFPSSTDIRFHF